MTQLANGKSYDSESLNGLQSAFDQASKTLGMSANSPAGERDTLAKHILGVAARGESDMATIAQQAVALMLGNES